MLRTRCGKPATAFAALGAALFFTASSFGAEPERVRFLTADFAEIQGLYYPSDLGIKASAVLMIHPVGSSIDAPGWTDLAKKLQEKHYAVLAFDFRGHGNSTAVTKDFWVAERTNQALKGYRSGNKPKLTISEHDFRNSSNILSMLNDISAAKRFLDAKNDASECNSAKLIVIGAGSGATLGATWINSEWRRRAVKSGFPVINNTPPEGRDVAAAVWLSMTSSAGVSGGPRWTARLENYVGSPVRDHVPMLFLYGEQDTRAASLAKNLQSIMAKNVKDKKLKDLDREVAIKDTKLSGTELLGKDALRTEEKIIAYLSQVFEDRLPNAWAKKDVDKTAFTVFPINMYLR
jgi:pimeloyl-ACP methyl ester carboxylesterase